MICRWVKDYIAEGETAFIPKGHPGNPFAALHVSKNLSEFRKVFCKFSIKVCKPRSIRCFTVICKNKIILFLAKFLHLLSGQTADKNNILLKLRPTGLLKIRSVNFFCKANFIYLCQITLYSFSSFSISVPSIFFRTALNAIFSRSVGFISVIFLPSRS